MSACGIICNFVRNQTLFIHKSNIIHTQIFFYFQLYSYEGRISFTSHIPGEHVICLYSNSTKWVGASQLRVHLDIQVGEHAIDYAQVRASLFSRFTYTGTSYWKNWTHAEGLIHILYTFFKSKNTKEFKMFAIFNFLPIIFLSSAWEKNNKS